MFQQETQKEDFFYKINIFFLFEFKLSNTVQLYNRVMFNTSDWLPVSSLWFLIITVPSLSNKAAWPTDTGHHSREDGRLLDGTVIPTLMKTHIIG